MPVMKKRLAMVIALLSGSLVALAEQATSGSAVLTKRAARALEAIASTSQEHLRLATYYRREARKFDEKVRYHEEMAEMYKKNPLPYDGKIAVPMQRHCKEWASRFAGQAERATVLAAFHDTKAFGHPSISTAPAQPIRWGLRSTGFSGGSALIIQATRQQSSLFHDSVTASGHFYDQVRILTYVVSANNQPPIEPAELRRSATGLFDAQRQFVGSLTEPQKAAVDAHVRVMQRVQRDLVNGLNQLGNETGQQASKSYFKAAKRIKVGLERWNAEQQKIALQLQIENSMHS